MSIARKKSGHTYQCASNCSSHTCKQSWMSFLLSDKWIHSLMTLGQHRVAPGSIPGGGGIRSPQWWNWEASSLTCWLHQTHSGKWNNIGRAAYFTLYLDHKKNRKNLYNPKNILKTLPMGCPSVYKEWRVSSLLIWWFPDFITSAETVDETCSAIWG